MTTPQTFARTHACWRSARKNRLALRCGSSAAGPHPINCMARSCQASGQKDPEFLWCSLLSCSARSLCNLPPCVSPVQWCGRVTGASQAASAPQRTVLVRHLHVPILQLLRLLRARPSVSRTPASPSGCPSRPHTFCSTRISLHIACTMEGRSKCAPSRRTSRGLGRRTRSTQGGWLPRFSPLAAAAIAPCGSSVPWLPRLPECGEGLA